MTFLIGRKLLKKQFLECLFVFWKYSRFVYYFGIRFDDQSMAQERERRRQKETESRRALDDDNDRKSSSACTKLSLYTYKSHHITIIKKLKTYSSNASAKVLFF